MKKHLCLILAAALVLIVSGQSANQQFQTIENSEFSLNSSASSSYMGKFALSANPLGFIQFGPIINAEFGLTDELVLNTHLRFPALGIATYVTKEHNDGSSPLLSSPQKSGSF